MPRNAIEDWLSILEQQANDRGVAFDTDVSGRIFHFLLGDQDPVLGKVRISAASSRSYRTESGEEQMWQRFDREQEKLEENPDQRVCSIQLDIESKGEFDEAQDHFLFIPGEVILQETYSKGDQKITISGDGVYEGELARFADDWDALFDYATGTLSLDDVDEERIQTKLDEMRPDDESGQSESTVSQPRVWIEKTQQKGRDYKQSGELALGKALISPSRDEGGRKRYETMREADVGDVVLHLLQEREQIVGVSRIASELQDNFEGPPDNRWSDEQLDRGGYRRDLASYVELEDPVDLYDDVLSKESFSDKLQHIRLNHDGKIIYNKRLALNQGHYFTQVPDELVSLLSSESRDLAEVLGQFDVDVSGLASGLPEPVESYDTLTEAMDDIRGRLDQSSLSNWLANELTNTVVKDWTGVLTNFNPSSIVSPTDEVRLQQLRDLYENNESRLQENAEKIGSGELNHISRPQTLFVAFLRELQEDAGLSTNVNQVKVKITLNHEYEIEEETDINESEDNEEDLSHPVLAHFNTQSRSVPVRKFTAPPEYWLTVAQYGTVSFEADQQESWDSVEPGEIAFLHTRSEPADDSLSGQPNGIIGVGILGEKSTKDEQWWIDEANGKTFPYLVTFERLFLTCNIDQFDLATPVRNKNTEELENELEALTTGILEYSEVQNICEDTNGISFPAQGAHGVFRDGEENIDHERPRALLKALLGRTEEIGTVNAHASFDGDLPSEPLEGLFFPGDQKREIIQQIEASLRSGKHIILTGPPGTGKTEIARKVCSYLADEYPYLYSDFQLTTATADWSTFDTVGGYMPDASGDVDDDLAFTAGVVLNRLKDRQTGLQLNEPIIIDELNRADIDKAFGQLFTLLSGQSVQLPYTRNDEEIELLTGSQTDGPARDNQYVVPESWRIFATMNTYDKTSLYEMSYAFMRRFSFIRVGAPSIPEDDGEMEDLIHDYAAAWEIPVSERDREELHAVGRVWREMNGAVENRAIGPAIVKDIIKYVGENGSIPLEDRLTRAVISYIFPQLEGVPKREQIVRQIASVRQIDQDGLSDAAAEMLQVSIVDDE